MSGDIYCAACNHAWVQHDFYRPAGDAFAWVDDGPANWSGMQAVGHIVGYWRWRGKAPQSATHRTAGWAYRAGFGGHGEYGALAATFEPHEYPHLRVSVAATLNVAEPGPGRFNRSRVGLPLDFAGGVLTGALQEPNAIGPGRLTFDYAAVDEVDSS